MKYNSLVALYVSRLPRTLQVNCYAQLLEGEEDCAALLCVCIYRCNQCLIEGIEDPSEQKQCLDLGKEAGLDVAVITKNVVEHIRNTGLVRVHFHTYFKLRS